MHHLSEWNAENVSIVFTGGVSNEGQNRVIRIHYLKEITAKTA